MLAHTIFFYFFSIITVGSALMVIVSKNTVHAVFFLILDFISVGCLFIMIGAEFLGMIMLIVYVGAVAVLFLFVVMMLNVAEQKQSWFRGLKSTHIPVGLIVSIIILSEVLVVIGGWKYKSNFIKTDAIAIDSNFSNTHQLGNVLYTDYIYLFQNSWNNLITINGWRYCFNIQKKRRRKKTKLHKSNIKRKQNISRCS